MPESTAEASMSSAEYRVVKKTWVMAEHSGESPNEGDNEPRSKEVVLKGKTKNIGGLDAERLEMAKDRYPTEDFDPDYGPQIGDTSHSYELQVLKDGKWVFEKTLQPYEEPKPQEE